MNVQMQNYRLYAHHNSFNDTLRITMRSRIYAILLHKSGRTDAVSQQKLISLANYVETELLSLAKSMEEYSELRDLEVRINSILKELQRCYDQSQHPTCHPSTVGISVPDGINALPDCLLAQILSNLSTKDSVKTSLLSKRWRNLWLEVPGLELNSTDFPSFPNDAIVNFIDKFLEFNPELNLQKFKIKYDECNVYLFGISELIGTVTTNRGAQYLDVSPLRCPVNRDFMPLDIYKSKRLVSLKLVNVGLANPEFVVSLPCLKIMHLENILCSNEDSLIMEKLISGCSVLEDLTVCRVFGDNVPVLRVRSQSLKRFCVKSTPRWRISSKEHGVEIDAPGLKYMNFKDDHSDRIVAKNLSSLFLIDIDTRFSCSWLTTLEMKKSTTRDFLTGISSARHMIISQRSLKVLYINLKLGPISKFHNLSRLEASFCTVLLQVLPDFLESFPNLKHLTLFLVYLSELEPKNLELTKVPQCLLSTLKCVEFKEVNVREIRGVKGVRSIKRHKKKIWMEAVKYILENSLLLKKLILRFSPTTITIADISKELLTVTKRSPFCEIFINLQIT